MKELLKQMKEILKYEGLLLFGICCLLVSSFITISHCYGKPYTLWMTFQYTPWWNWIIFIVGGIIAVIKIRE